MEPLQHGLVADHSLVTLHWLDLPGLETPGYHPEQLCPHRRYWQGHPEAPWNAIWSDSPEFWRELDARNYGDVADEDPGAPWNQPEPSRDPADYQDLDGSPLLWVAPEVVPMVKLAQPTFNAATHRLEPTLVWFSDRVERDWQIVELSQEEAAAVARKVWPNSAAFLGEFSMPELAAISISTDATVAALRVLLLAWPSDVWSDDPRIVMGLAALVSAGIIDETRKSQILAK